MKHAKFLRAASTALMIVIAITLALPSVASAAGKYKVLHKFHGPDGSHPDTSLIFDAAGNLYGTTYQGGGSSCEVGCGVVFKLTPNANGSWTESKLHAFHGGHDGEYPNAGLIFDAAGNLYGTTIYGGGETGLCDEGCGVVFKLTPNADGSWTESVLYSFLGGNYGQYPRPGLVFDVAGNLYGTTTYGGASDDGMVFKLTPNADGSWTESVAYAFNYSDGAYPAGLIFDATGNLYGTTYDGGAHKYGTVFKLTPNADGSWTESVLHSFNDKGSDGHNPLAGLTFDEAGNLYGKTLNGGNQSYCYGGCGAIFKLTPNVDGSWTESVLHRFKEGRGSSYLFAGLTFDGMGTLYGTTPLGGSGGWGAAFKLSPNVDGSWTYSLIHVFDGKPAEYPYDGLVFGSAGTLYGTTISCSSGCYGVVYEITP